MKLGKRAVKPDKPSHTRGVHMGNAVGNYAKQPGFTPEGRRTAESSTGVSAGGRQPIDPRMPGLFPG
jgi:hypothetical protein